MEFPPTAATLEILPNGLSLILDPDPSTPVTSTQLWVETGSIHEGHLLGSGISHFLEHMVFKGAGDFGPAELAESVQAAGGHWNAYTSFDRTVYYIDGPASGLDTFLKVLAAMVFNPHLPESEFEKEKDVIRREIAMGLDDPDNVNHQLMFSTTFTRDARRHPVIGHRELFDRISYDELRTYHATRYTPDRACLCLAGDFDPLVVRKQIDTLFATVPRGSGAEPMVPADPAQLGPRRGRGTFAIPVSKLTLAWKVPALDHPDAPAFDLAAAMLGRGRSAHLYRTLRESRGLALEISAWSWTQVEREGLFAVSAEVEPDKRDELLAAIREELAAFPSSQIDEALAKAKRQVIASQLRSLTTISGRATDLASNWHEARDLNFTRHYLARLDQVTPGDVRRALASLSPDQETLTILYPEEAPAPTAGASSASRRGEPETFTLANGTTVALLPDPRVPVIALQAAIRAGSSSETPTSAGLNRLLASALPQATRHHSAAELAETLESLGASIGASSGNNSMLLQMSGLSPDLASLVPLFGEVLAEPALESDSIEREKASQLASLQEALEDPLSLGFRSLRKALFGESGYGIPSLGDETSLDGLNRLALSAHHSLHFRGPNLAVALAGDFDPAEAKELLTTAFNPMQGGDPWSPAPSDIQQASEQTLALEKEQAVLALGYPGCAALDENRHALRFLQEWCSDMAGPLFTRIREELGLAYQVGATQFHGHDTGLFAFYLATAPSQVELTEKELRAQIELLADEGIPADAFERVRATVLSATAIEQQAPASIARHAAIDLLFGLPATHHRELTKTYQSVTPEDVRMATQKLLASRAPTIVRVLPDKPMTP
ncbi:MAG: pitrilysin family protein [Verrucomicrobiota bacterium]